MQNTRKPIPKIHSTTIRGRIILKNIALAKFFKLYKKSSMNTHIWPLESFFETFVDIIVN